MRIAKLMAAMHRKALFTHYNVRSNEVVGLLFEFLAFFEIFWVGSRNACVYVGSRNVL